MSDEADAREERALAWLRVGQRWRDPEDGSFVTVCGIDPGTMYPVQFQWDGQRNFARNSAVGFLANFQPPSLLEFLESTRATPSPETGGAAVLDPYDKAERDGLWPPAAPAPEPVKPPACEGRKPPAVAAIYHWQPDGTCVIERLYSDADMKRALADAAALREQRDELRAEVSRLKGLLPADTVDEFAKRVGAIHAAREKLAAAAIPEGTPGDAKPETWAAVQIGRCPNCDEFPAEWQSGGMPCSECGVDLSCDIDATKDGAELWTFDFANQDDYDKKHAPGGAPAEGLGTTRTPAAGTAPKGEERCVKHGDEMHSAHEYDPGTAARWALQDNIGRCPYVIPPSRGTRP